MAWRVGSTAAPTAGAWRIGSTTYASYQPSIVIDSLPASIQAGAQVDIGISGADAADVVASGYVRINGKDVTTEGATLSAPDAATVRIDALPDTLDAFGNSATVEVSDGATSASGITTYAAPAGWQVQAVNYVYASDEESVLDAAGGADNSAALENGVDQLAWGNVVGLTGLTVNADGTYAVDAIDNAVSGTFDYRVWDESGQSALQWGSVTVEQAPVSLAGAVVSTSVVAAADLRIDAPLAGAVVSTSTVGSADLSVGVPLAGAVAATSAVAEPQLRIAAPLAGAISLVSVLGAADLQIPQPLALAGGLVSSSAMSGQLRLGVPLSGAIVSSSGIAGNVNVGVPLSGALAATSGLSGKLGVPAPLHGSLASESAMYAALSAGEPGFLSISQVVLLPTL